MGPWGGADLRFLFYSPQPDTSLHCEATKWYKQVNIFLLEYRVRRQKQRSTLHTFKVFASGSAGKSILGSQKARLGSDCSYCTCCYRVTVSVAHAFHLLTETKDIIRAISCQFLPVFVVHYTSRENNVYVTNLRI